MDMEAKLRDTLNRSSIKMLQDLPRAAFTLCESPIEELMFMALWARGTWTGALRVGEASCSMEVLHLGHPIGCAPQVPIGEWRVDFLLGAWRESNEPPVFLAIECDGHDFHERTKDQAARDRSRDRALLSRGFQVMRFTGSEIWSDPIACAEQALQYVDGELAASASREAERAELSGSHAAIVDAAE